MGCIAHVHLENRRGGCSGGEADSGYLPRGSSWVKVWERWSTFVLLGCCTMDGSFW